MVAYQHVSAEKSVVVRRDQTIDRDEKPPIPPAEVLVGGRFHRTKPGACIAFRKDALGVWVCCNQLIAG